MENTSGKNKLEFDKFRENLKGLIKSKGLSGRDLAAELETTPATISRYLNGVRNPEIDNLYRLSQYMGVTIDFLLGVNGDNSTGLTPEARRMAALYMMASDSDQNVVDALLAKYGEP